MFLIGLCLTCFSVPFAISMFTALNNIPRNPYQYTISYDSEIETLSMLAVLAVIVALIGITMMIVGWIKQSNKAILDSIENTNQQSLCKHCGLNVATGIDVCPICGKNLKE